MIIDLPLNLNTITASKTSITKIYCDGDVINCSVLPSEQYDLIKISTLINGELINRTTKFDIPLNIDTKTDTVSSNMYSRTFSIYITKQNKYGDEKITKHELIYTLFLYKSTLLNTIGKYNIIDAQMIDNDDNHIFFVIETENNHIIFNKLKQIANRKMVYLRKKAETIPVIGTNTPQIEKAHNGIYYNIASNNSNVIFTPLSANISNTQAIEDGVTYGSPETQTINVLNDIIKH